MDAALRYGGATPMPYAEFCLCREMGWTYTELDEQPAYRIEQAFLFLNREHVFNKTKTNE